MYQTDPTLPITEIEERTLNSINTRTKAKKNPSNAASRMRSLALNSANKLQRIFFPAFSE
jgi:hypothetical protein